MCGRITQTQPLWEYVTNTGRQNAELIERVN
jgi:hypothetical protein